MKRTVKPLEEAVAPGWIDASLAYLTAAGLAALSYALGVYGPAELGRLAEGVAAFAVGVAWFTAEGYRQLNKQHGDLLDQLLKAEDPYREPMRLEADKLPGPLQNLRKALTSGDLRNASEEEKNALVLATIALTKWLGEHAHLLEEMTETYKRLEEGWQEGEVPFDVLDELTRTREELLKVAERLRKELNSLSAKYELRELLVDEKKAKQLAKATYNELPSSEEVSVGVKAYAAVLGIINNTLYGRIAATLLENQQLADLLRWAPYTAYNATRKIGVKDVSKHEARYLAAFAASLPPNKRRELEKAKFVKSREDGKKIVWELKTAGGTAVTLTFERKETGSWTVQAEGPLAEELRERLWKKEFESWKPGTVPEEIKDALILGWLASDLSLKTRKGKLQEVSISTAHGWQLARLREILGSEEWGPERVVNVTLEGARLDVRVRWRVDRLNKIIGGSTWLRELAERGLFREVQTLEGPKRMPPADIDDLIIRLRWEWVLEIVKKMETELKQLITCGKRRCDAKELFNEMLNEFEGFVDEVKSGSIGYAKAREYLAPALLLLELETAENRDKALWRFGLVFAEAVAGDGHVRNYRIELASGEGGPALLWLATLKKAGFKPTLRVMGNGYRLDFSSGDVVAPAAVMLAVGINPKAEKAMNMFREEAERGSVKVDVQRAGTQETKEGAVAIKVKAGPWEEEYRVYLDKDKIKLRFYSADVDRVHQAAHVLGLIGVKTEPRKESGRDVWHIYATTNVLADRRVLPKFREVLAEAVEEARQRGWVKAETAERWIRKLREGITVAEDMPMFAIRIANRSLNIVHYTTSGEKLRVYVKQLEELGLKEVIHFTVKQPANDKSGHLYITAEGVVKLADLWRHAEDAEIRRKAEEWIKHLLARAEESGGAEVREKLERLIEEGERRGALTLVGVHEVEVEEGGAKVKHLVEVRQAKPWVDGDRLRIHVKAAVDGVEVEREFVFFRHRNATIGRVSTRAGAPGGREADIKRLKAISKVIFGDPGDLRGNRKELEYTRRHLEHAMRFEEIKDEIERWLNI